MGKSIQLAGPSILLTYLLVGTALFFVMRALGELLLSNSGYTSFTDFATDYIGPWAGFVTGWTYWYMSKYPLIVGAKYFTII